jgi:type I restriction enzyme R subunit
MSKSPEFATTEAGGAQLQALHTLINCGWRYVTRSEADQWRNGRRSQTFLEMQLRADLARINRIYLDDRAYLFSEANIDAAVRRLADRIPEGVVRANERMTDDLTLGIALPQSMGATSREWPFRFIDWSDWRANNFQVTSEYTVMEPGGNQIRVDLVLFVNGIPVGIIEVKSSQVGAEQGVMQQLRNQKTEEGVPSLFYSAQILVAANPFDPRYGTVGTPRKLWSVWKERQDADSFIRDLVNRPMDSIEGRRVSVDFAPHMKQHAELMALGREATALDKTLIGLCRPERLMRMLRRYTLFDTSQKKIARYQQVSTIESLLKRTEERDERGRRKGGVVWETQGSGKSLEMVMLAKAIVLANPNARIILVTDRTDLDDQILKTFRATGQEPKRATTGEHLLSLIESKTPVVTTLIHKFRAGLNKRRVIDESPDIFCLVDESQRTQYGDLESLHARMREVLPNACFIAFTGTPIAKKERNTFAKFGDLVRPSYSMRDAIADKAVVPLLYEGWEVPTDVDAPGIDHWFDVHTRNLTDAQRADLKRKMSRAREIEGVESRLQSIAFDIGQHFAENFKGTGLKGQIAAPSKRAAVLLKKLFDTFEVIATEVVISAPEMREADDDEDESRDEEVRKFWRKMIDRYGGEDSYNRSVIEAFKGPGDPEIVIVVNKLLTGFDAPRNTVLYLCRHLREHSLLQAIARVNRVFDEEDAQEKPYGYIIDYTGVLKDLTKALATYDALQGFTEDDIAQTVVSLKIAAGKVATEHGALLDIFKSISNTYDAEAYALLLADEEVRAEFYRRLTDFSRSLTVALASPSFVDTTKPEVLNRWKQDVVRFTALRASVGLRYAERVDWKFYETRVRKLLDRHINAGEAIMLVEPINIFDDIKIDERRIAKIETDASIADTIAHQMARSIEERWDEDPVFFEKFSKLIRDTIADFHDGRINEITYLAKVRELRDKVQRREDSTDPTPERLRQDTHAQVFWGLARRNLDKAGLSDSELAADIALEASRIMHKHRKIGWQNDRDIENQIRNDIDDFLFEELHGRRNQLIDPSVMDTIVDDVLASARVRLAQ